MCDWIDLSQACHKTRIASSGSLVVNQARQWLGSSTFTTFAVVRLFSVACKLHDATTWLVLAHVNCAIKLPSMLKPYEQWRMSALFTSIILLIGAHCASKPNFGGFVLPTSRFSIRLVYCSFSSWHVDTSNFEDTQTQVMGVAMK